jgi:hypothetical protein
MQSEAARKGGRWCKPGARTALGSRVRSLARAIGAWVLRKCPEKTQR